MSCTCIILDNVFGVVHCLCKTLHQEMYVQSYVQCYVHISIYVFILSLIRLWTYSCTPVYHMYYNYIWIYTCMYNLILGCICTILHQYIFKLSCIRLCNINNCTSVYYMYRNYVYLAPGCVICTTGHQDPH